MKHLPKYSKHFSRDDFDATSDQRAYLQVKDWGCADKSCSCNDNNMSSPRRLSGRSPLLRKGVAALLEHVCPVCRAQQLSTSARRSKQRSAPFGTRWRAALKDTKVQWKPIPVGLGIAFVGALQLYRVQAREKKHRDDEDLAVGDESVGDGSSPRPKKRKRIRPSGPW